jgi:hypothetical protein
LDLALKNNGFKWGIQSNEHHSKINGHVRPKFQGISPQNMARNMVQYLEFRILEFPLIKETKHAVLISNTVMELLGKSEHLEFCSSNTNPWTRGL